MAVQGERIIVSLDPDYNPTGKKDPSVLLKMVQEDPEFDELSKQEQKNVLNKINSMIKNMHDIKKYGTLKDKIKRASCWENGKYGNDDRPYITYFPQIVGSAKFGVLAAGTVVDMLEGADCTKGQTVVYLQSKNLSSHDLVMFRDVDIFLKSGIDDPLNLESVLAEIVAPISGKVFFLTEVRSSPDVPKVWGEDLFIISSVPDDTRREALAWYTETTGKIPSYKSKEDIALEKQESKRKVSSFLSKFDI